MIKKIIAFGAIFINFTLITFAEINLNSFEKNGLWGYKNEAGIEIIEAKFIEASGFKNNYAVVKTFDSDEMSFKYGIIKENGNFKVKPKYDFLSEIYNDRIIYLKDNKYGLLSSSGKVILSNQFDKISNYSEDSFVFSLKGKFGYIDDDGKISILPLFDEAYSFKNGFAKVKYLGKYKFVDKLGTIYDKNPLDIKKTEPIDTSNLPQDANAYLNLTNKNQDLLLDNYSKLINENFKKMYFAPWHKTPSFSQKELQGINNYYKNNFGYGVNKLPNSKKWIDDILINTNIDNFPIMNKRAITLRNSDIRLLPTREPIYNNFDIAGQGYPFDMLQNSGIHANTPILVTHKSRDNQWYFVETPFCEGWIHSDNIAFTDDNFIKNWESGTYKVIIEDKVPFYDEYNNFKFSANLGALFPSAEGDEVYFASEGPNKTAIILKQKISNEYISQMPVKLNKENIAFIINKLIGKPYGWGGFLENRDCSSTLKDLFTVFGLWLPRNSSEQAKSMIFTSMKDLSLEDKEKLIINNGTPFATLLWMNGHIMLYIGNIDGKAIIFHNMWGVRTKDDYGNEGRKIIGSSVITTLEPYKELSNITSTLLERIEGMTTLIPPTKLQNMITSY